MQLVFMVSVRFYGMFFNTPSLSEASHKQLQFTFLFLSLRLFRDTNQNSDKTHPAQLCSVFSQTNKQTNNAEGIKHSKVHINHPKHGGSKSAMSPALKFNHNFMQQLFKL